MHEHLSVDDETPGLLRRRPDRFAVDLDIDANGLLLDTKGSCQTGILLQGLRLEVELPTRIHILLLHQGLHTDRTECWLCFLLIPGCSVSRVGPTHLTGPPMNDLKLLFQPGVVAVNSNLENRSEVIKGSGGDCGIVIIRR